MRAGRLGGRQSGRPHPARTPRRRSSSRPRSTSAAPRWTPAAEAELLELLAGEYYLIDRLDDAIGACRRRDAAPVAGSATPPPSAPTITRWPCTSGTTPTAEEPNDHAHEAVTVLDGDDRSADAAKLVQLGHAFAMQAYLALQASDLDQAATAVDAGTRDRRAGRRSALAVRVGLHRRLLRGARWEHRRPRRDPVDSRGGPTNIDEIYSSGYSNLTYLDVEQRRLDRRRRTARRQHSVDGRARPAGLSGLAAGLARQARSAEGDWDDARRRRRGRARRARAHRWRAPGRCSSAPWSRCAGTAHAAGRDRRRVGRWPTATASRCACCPPRPPIAERRGSPAPPTTASRVPFDAGGRARRGSRNGRAASWRCGCAGWAPRVEADRRRRARIGCCSTGLTRRRHGCSTTLATPYDAALALIDSGDADLARARLDMLDRLGRRCRRRQGAPRSAGGGSHRGACPAPVHDAGEPGGTDGAADRGAPTARRGLTNAELAERLYLSVKTVDHHVSAILTKLQVTRRGDAVRRARELGIVS